MDPVPAFRTAAVPVELYRQPGVRVTSEAFLVAGRRFPISELSDLRTARGRQDPLTVRAVAVTGAALGAIGVALGYAGELYRLSARTYLLLGLAAFIPMALAAIGRRLRPPAYELWGRYRGSMVLLFSTDQERQFGQIRRALIRAREVYLLGGVGDPVGGAAIWRPGER